VTLLTSILGPDNEAEGGRPGVVAPVFRAGPSPEGRPEGRAGDRGVPGSRALKTSVRPCGATRRRPGRQTVAFRAGTPGPQCLDADIGIDKVRSHSVRPASRSEMRWAAPEGNAASMIGDRFLSRKPSERAALGHLTVDRADLWPASSYVTIAADCWRRGKIRG
jgi:hypothetical protein